MMQATLLSSTIMLLVLLYSLLSLFNTRNNTNCNHIDTTANTATITTATDFTSKQMSYRIRRFILVSLFFFQLHNNAAAFSTATHRTAATTHKNSALSVTVNSANVAKALTGAQVFRSTLKLFNKQEAQSPLLLPQSQPLASDDVTDNPVTKSIDNGLHRLSSWAFEQADVQHNGQLTTGQVYGGVLAVHWQLMRFAGGILQPFLGPPPQPAAVVAWCRQARYSKSFLGRTEFRRVITRATMGHAGSHILMSLVTVFVVMPVLQRTPLLNKLVLPSMFIENSTLNSSPLLFKVALFLWQHSITTMLGFRLVPAIWRPIDKWWGNQILPKSSAYEEDIVAETDAFLPLESMQLSNAITLDPNDVIMDY